MPQPLTDTERDTIRTRHAEGASCTAIARELGRSPGTISRHAHAMGLGWDTRQTAHATAAKQASNRERRAALIARLYDQADKLMDRLDAQVFKYVGEDRSGNAVVTDLPADAIPGTEVRALLGMAVNTLQGAARLEAVDAGQAGSTEARGILSDLGDALQAAYGQLAHTGGSRAVLEDADAGDTGE